MENLDSPESILSVTEENGLNYGMIAEIFGDVTAEDVNHFFAGHEEGDLDLIGISEVAVADFLMA